MRSYLANTTQWSALAPAAPAAATPGEAPVSAARRPARLVAGDILLDRRMLRVWRGSRQIRLRRSEFRLLEWLMSHAGYVYSRAELLELVWPDHRGVGERAVDACVVRLRRALNRPGESDPIRTVRFAGYAFDEQFPHRNSIAFMAPAAAE